MEVDLELKVFTLAKSLMVGLTYPYDWGFIPPTQAEDGDPLDDRNRALRIYRARPVYEPCLEATSRAPLVASNPFIGLTLRALVRFGDPASAQREVRPSRIQRINTGRSARRAHVAGRREIHRAPLVRIAPVLILRCRRDRLTDDRIKRAATIRTERDPLDGVGAVAQPLHLRPCENQPHRAPELERAEHSQFHLILRASRRVKVNDAGMPAMQPRSASVN